MSIRFEKKNILKSSIFFLLIGLLFLISENIYIIIFGLGLFTLCFFAAHTMASQMIALHAKEGKSSATSIYWLFYYFGSSFLGSGTGYLLHATSWNIFILILAAAISISFLLTIKNKSQKID